MRRALLEIPVTALDRIFIKQPEDGELHLRVHHPLPGDAKMLDCRFHPMRRVFQLIYESSEFAEIPDGDVMPTLKPITLEYIECPAIEL